MILVTGASGKVGTALVPKLREAGHEVRVLTRSSGGFPPGVEVVQGALEDPETLARAVLGVDRIIHLAALIKEGEITDAPLMEEVRRTNVKPTRSLAELALRSRVSAFIHISTSTVFGSGQRGRISPETNPEPDTAYGLSKREAEEALHEVLAGSPVRHVILRPVLICASSSSRHDVLAELVARARRGRLILPREALRSGHSLIAREDVVAGITAALTRGAPGSAYMLSSPRPYPLEEILATVRQRTGRRTHYTLPLWLMRRGADLCELLDRTFGTDLPLSHRRLDKLLRNQEFDTTRTRDELGFTPRITAILDLVAPYLG